jgi:hypothetical protein
VGHGNDGNAFCPAGFYGMDQIRAHNRNNNTTAQAAMDDKDFFAEVLGSWWRCFDHPATNRMQLWIYFILFLCQI